MHCSRDRRLGRSQERNRCEGRFHFPLAPAPAPFLFPHSPSLSVFVSLSRLLSLSRPLSLFLSQYVCGCPCACMQTYLSVSKTPVPMRAHTGPMQVIGALWPTRRRRATL